DRARQNNRAWPHGDVSYASKANSNLPLLRWAHEEGLSVDVASNGELEAALLAGVPGSHIRLHGNYKTDEDIFAASRAAVGEVVADSLVEIETLARLGWKGRVALRLALDVHSGSSDKVSTSHPDTKFGLSVATGDALTGVRTALDNGLGLIGFHCHVGSMMSVPGPVAEAARAMASFAQETKRAIGYWPETVNLGGGLAVDYTPDDEPVSVTAYCASVAQAAKEALGDPCPELRIEPGRSIAAPAGLTIYRVGVVKRSSSGRKFVAVDGGMSDNPRPALYGARYTVLSFRSETSEPATVVGRHCESDVMFKDAHLPSGIAPGDLLQVLHTGAYNASMASNYNRFLRPATVAIQENGEERIIERRETLEDIFAREERGG
ncbi:MAG: diaminopimelate decarboxylase, partial [Fimbriimonadaceae bacterium]